MKEVCKAVGLLGIGLIAGCASDAEMRQAYDSQEKVVTAQTQKAATITLSCVQGCEGLHLEYRDPRDVIVPKVSNRNDVVMSVTDTITGGVAKVVPVVGGVILGGKLVDNLSTMAGGTRTSITNNNLGDGANSSNTMTTSTSSNHTIESNSSTNTQLNGSQNTDNHAVVDNHAVNDNHAVSTSSTDNHTTVDSSNHAVSDNHAVNDNHAVQDDHTSDNSYVDSHNTPDSHNITNSQNPITNPAPVVVVPPVVTTPTPQQTP